MPHFGAHMSIAGGYHKAIDAAAALGMEACQLFTKSNQQWRAKPISMEEVAAFRDSLKRSKIHKLISHTSYLINLASPNESLYRQSVEAFVVEMQRAEMLGLDGVVTHPGAFCAAVEQEGLERVVAAIDEIHARCPGCHARILIETTAGQGTCLGQRFEQLGFILKNARQGDRLGVCVDTCHIFAAGYPLAPRRAYLGTMRAFDKLVGVEHIEAFHLNDSLKPLGSRRDRHAHIGRGELGIEPFRNVVNDCRFRDLPMILETPKGEENDRCLDAINLEVLQGLLGTRKRRPTYGHSS